MSEQDAFDKLRQELRRGALVLAVLTQLKDEHYGYSLRKSLAESGLEIDEGTLYPLIRRLESQGILNSEWREENNRKKRFYIMSSMGDTVFHRLLQEWQQLNHSIEQLLSGESA